MLNKELLRDSRQNLRFLILSIALGAGVGGLIILQARLISKIISLVFLESYTLSQVQSDITYLIVLILARAMFVFLRDIASGELSARVMFSLRNELFSKILQFGPVKVGQEKTGELSNVVFQGIERLDAYFKDYLPQLALAVIVPCLVLIFVFPIDWLTGILFLVTAPLIPFFMILIGKQAEYETKRQWNLLGSLNGYFFDVIRGLETLKNFGQSKMKTHEIREKSTQYAEVTLGVLRIAFLSALVLEMLATISTAVVAVQIGLRLLYGQIAFEDGLFLLILAPEFYFPLRQLGASFHSGREGVASAERIYSILNQPGVDINDSPITPIEFRTQIEFRNVSFNYSNQDQPSVSNLSFTINKGQRVALVGSSGGGKSTVAALLLGFVSPFEGKILIDGEPLISSNVQNWRKKIAYIPQFPYLFNGSIEDNLRIAKYDCTLEEMRQAAILANADEFISRLPHGYKTSVGENGAKISRGQAQRLAITRTFLKNAPFLIIDEPTENLDPQNDRRFTQALRQLMGKSTVLVIAHRLSTVMDADQIIVLENGKAVEVGTHAALLVQGGAYAKIVKNGGEK